jgi:cell division transport system permease protein
MIGISFARVSRAAFQNFWRNVWLSAATTLIMTITLLMISFLYFANVFGGEVLKSIEQKVDLSITFKDDVQEEYISAVARELESRADVENVRVISSDEALAIFRARHEDDPLIEESLQELEDNPLPATMYIIATQPQLYENIAKHLSSERYNPYLDKINFESNRNVIERLISLISSIKNIGIIITVIFAILVILIMFNTVRLAIYSFREEIDIMHLVGASRWFIQGPFIVESLVVALLAVAISTIILYPTLSATAPQLQRFFFDTQGNQFNIYDFAIQNWLTVIGLQIITSAGLAILSSLIAVRRYIRN